MDIFYSYFVNACLPVHLPKIQNIAKTMEMFFFPLQICLWYMNSLQQVFRFTTTTTATYIYGICLIFGGLVVKVVHAKVALVSIFSIFFDASQYVYGFFVGLC